jgi:hypothetical protein
MNRHLADTLIVASLVVLSSSLQLVAQAPSTKAAVDRGQANPRTARELTPCVGAPMGPECAVFRLNRIDARLNELEELLGALEASIANLQGRSGLANLGPPIAPPRMPDEPADSATSMHLQRQIDALTKTVLELVGRVNAATANK